MLLDIARVRRHLKAFDLHTLFIEELGWEHHRQELIVAIDGQDFRLQALAHKRGLAAFRCDPDADGRIPAYPTRRKIETQVTKSVNQHLIIYTDAANTQQVWQWVKRAPGKPTASREQSFFRDQTGEALIQKLNAITFSIEDEADIGGIVQVAERVRAGFDVERVTKRFYERFKAEHAGFLEFLQGIPDEGLQRWYASVILNRLMFIYFIQRKGFLDSDLNYLRTRLAASQDAVPDRYYADFLCPLFFEGFARRPDERSAATGRLLGQVPYLNGGIFERHPIETAHGPTIRVPDTAFERLFDFFDAYQWRLDERPLRADNEINPDVLGYIFEKYINQKQMGAYYTREDITGYISQNTVIPYLFDAARQRMASGQTDKRMNEGTGQRIETDKRMSGGTVWVLLAAEPDRYIYPAMRHGAELPLPPEIATGLADVARRTEWNRPAPAEYALPTEIWREVVARRQRYADCRSQIANGKITSVNDLITLNLDIRQFAQDVIAECEGPELLRAFWQAIESVTILDPTVGSGAFLFAALNVLEPLYEGCLERMQAFVDDLDRSGEPHRPEKFSDFRKVLARVAQHPNRRYFILKSIVVNNLYGVDIMEEAVEICKLRLFLKLVAQVERVEDIEPLPDIDFNVRAGNTLVGYATREDVQRALTTATDGRMKLMFEEESTALQRFEERAADVERLFGLFRQQQTELGGQVTAGDKAELRRRLDALDDELNRALAREYGVDDAKPKAYKDWLASHRPLHWFVEFYGIMRRGGFDVLIGNPPYVEYSKVRDGYSVQSGYVTLPCGNLYALVMERGLGLLQRFGHLGLIVPLSLVCTERMRELRDVVLAHTSWIACFDMRPSSLFEGVAQRLAILLLKKSESLVGHTLTGGYRRWTKEERPALMATIAYTSVTLDQTRPSAIPKLASALEGRLLAKLVGVPLSQLWDDAASPIYVHRIVRYFVKALSFIPVFVGHEGVAGKSEDYKEFRFAETEQMPAVDLLNSSLFYWFWRLHSDGFHCGYGDVFRMRYDRSISAQSRSQLHILQEDLMEGFRKSSVEKAVQTKSGSIRYQEFRPKAVKTIIDEIDRVLARHYGFTDEELDFIINYDIKYRMGDALEDGATDGNG